MTPAQSVVAAMITPALLILASSSLVATALVRLGRVVDRSRVLIATIDAGSVPEPEALRCSLDRHQRRALYAERSVGLFLSRWSFLSSIAYRSDSITSVAIR